MTEIKTGRELDAEMMEKVCNYWLVKERNDFKWMPVLSVYPDEFRVWEETLNSPARIAKNRVAALHRPTDNPQMATAYLMGEPEEVTREEAARMVSVYEDWDWQDDEADIWMPSYSEDDINIAASVRSPGGNVYKIKD